MVRDNPRLAKERYGHPAESLEKATMPIDLLERLESHIKLEPADPVEEVQLSKDQKVRFGTALINETMTRLKEFLMCRVATFAWSPKDVTGLDPTLITHKLSVDKAVKLV